MSTDALSEVLDFPIPERIRAAQAIWDSIAAEPDQVPVSAEMRAEIRERLDEYRRNPEAVEPWDEVRRRLGASD
jgi:putative addiction module component (TIGR02574 family)